MSEKRYYLPSTHYDLDIVALPGGGYKAEIRSDLHWAVGEAGSPTRAAKRAVGRLRNVMTGDLAPRASNGQEEDPSDSKASEDK